MREGQPSLRTRRSNQTALIRRDPAPTLHHRRNRRAARIRDNTTHRHHLCRGCGRKVARGRDDATTPMCHRLESKGITRQRHPLSTLAWSTHNAPKSLDKDPTPEPSNRKEEATTAAATAHLASEGDRTHGRHLHHHGAHQHRRKQRPLRLMARQRGSTPATTAPRVGSTSPPRPPLRNHGTCQPQRRSAAG